MIRAVLFDLDDTLYPEGEFYRSGFAWVAEELERRGIGPATSTREVMESIHFNESRDGVFDKVAARIGFPADWVPELVGLFHKHRPRVSLPEKSKQLLARLRPQYRLGIVTDGHAAVQRRKIESLGVEPLVDAIVVADDLGREHWKPHPLPLLTCCKMLGVDAAESVFVGDNPERDMQCARNAGAVGVRLRSGDGYFNDNDEPASAAAAFEIGDVCELENVLSSFERLPCQ